MGTRVLVKWVESHEQEVVLGNIENDEPLMEVDIDTHNPTYKSCGFVDMIVLGDEPDEPEYECDDDKEPNEDYREGYQQEENKE